MPNPGFAESMAAANLSFTQIGPLHHFVKKNKYPKALTLAM